MDIEIERKHEVRRFGFSSQGVCLPPNPGANPGSTQNKWVVDYFSTLVLLMFQYTSSSVICLITVFFAVLLFYDVLYCITIISWKHY
jgi:hypothetical protein